MYENEREHFKKTASKVFSTCFFLYIGLVLACFLVFVMAMFYEGLKVLRETLLRRSVVNIRTQTLPIKGSQTMLTETHQAGE